jgi:hypothetical protein
MQMNEAMDYLTAEAVRLEAMGVTKSTVIMSTLTDGGNVARMTITVDLVQIPQREEPAPRPSQPIQAPQAPPSMSQQQRYSGGVTGGPNPGPMPGMQVPQDRQGNPMR